MEHAIGEIVTLPDGTKAQVVRGRCSYKKCIFRAKRLCTISDEIGFASCAAHARKDHKNIIYKEIKEE